MRTHGTTLGHPLQSNTIGQGEFKRLIAQAGIKSIKFHGVGLGIYAHVLPA